jgi:hypothetical protein
MMRTPRPGSGERLAPHDLVGEPQLGPDPAHLVLEQVAQRLDEVEVEILGEPADVVVALDLRRVLGAGLDHIGVERALHQEGGVLDPARRLLEHPDEQLADRLALVLGIGDARQSLEEPVAGPHVDQFDPLVALEGLDHLLGLAGPHQSGVDVDAGEPVSDRPVHEGGGHGRVDAARQPADGPAVTDLFLDGLDRRVDDRLHRPARVAAGQAPQELFEQGRAVRGVDDLGVVLHPVDATLIVLEHRHRRVVGGGRGHEALRHLGDGVEVAHPHDLLRWDPGVEQRCRRRLAGAGRCARTRLFRCGRRCRRAGGR